VSLLDVGCGNGRHLLPARDSGVALFGCDFIARFVEICVHDRNLEVLRCDAQHLPYRSNLFDNVM
jgi:SAM-dependent methyltransferase